MPIDPFHIEIIASVLASVGLGVAGLVAIGFGVYEFTQ